MNKSVAVDVKPDLLTFVCTLFVLSEMARNITALLVVVGSVPVWSGAESAALFGTAPKCPRRMQGMPMPEYNGCAGR